MPRKSWKKESMKLRKALLKIAVILNEEVAEELSGENLAKSP
jgi:hypothetical protein